MCREGGCGCCVVAITKSIQSQSGKEDITLSVNSVSYTCFCFCPIGGQVQM